MESMGLVLGIVGFGAFFVLLFMWSKRQRAKIGEAWGEFANRYGLDYQPGRYPATGGVLEGHAFRMLAEPELTAATKRIKTQMPPKFTITLELLGDVPEDLIVAKKGLLGGGSLQTGDPEFDRKCLVQTKDPERAMAYLTPERRLALVRMVGSGAQLEGGLLAYTQSGYKAKSEWLEEKTLPLRHAAHALDVGGEGLSPVPAHVPSAAVAGSGTTYADPEAGLWQSPKALALGLAVLVGTLVSAIVPDLGYALAMNSWVLSSFEVWRLLTFSFVGDAFMNGVSGAIVVVGCGFILERPLGSKFLLLALGAPMRGALVSIPMGLEFISGPGLMAGGLAGGIAARFVLKRESLEGGDLYWSYAMLAWLVLTPLGFFAGTLTPWAPLLPFVVSAGAGAGLVHRLLQEPVAPEGSAPEFR